MATKVGTKRTMKNEQGVNQVKLVGFIASAISSRDGKLARRIEIPTAGAKEVIDLICEKDEIFKVFRGLRVNQWVAVEGRIRRQFWRTGATLASRSYVEVFRIAPR